MKRSIGIAAGLIGISMLIGCSSRATIVDSGSDTEKIQIIGQIETPAPIEDAGNIVSNESYNMLSITPEPVLITEAPTAIPTEKPTEEPTPEPTPEPTEEPTPEPEETPEPVSLDSRKSGRSKTEQFCDLAKSFLDTPYQRGGTDPENGFDPGGFVYYCLNQTGVKVRHKTSKGYSENESWQRIDSMDDLQPGDLCFFMTPGNETVNCVCIYLGNDQIVYPSSGEGKVITARITSNYWTEAFVFARRVF